MVALNTQRWRSVADSSLAIWSTGVVDQQLAPSNISLVDCVSKKNLRSTNGAEMVRYFRFYRIPPISTNQGKYLKGSQSTHLRGECAERR